MKNRNYCLLKHLKENGWFTKSTSSMKRNPWIFIVKIHIRVILNRSFDNIFETKNYSNIKCGKSGIIIIYLGLNTSWGLLDWFNLEVLLTLSIHYNRKFDSNFMIKQYTFLIYLLLHLSECQLSTCRMKQEWFSFESRKVNVKFGFIEDVNLRILLLSN